MYQAAVQKVEILPIQEEHSRVDTEGVHMWCVCSRELGGKAQAAPETNAMLLQAFPLQEFHLESLQERWSVNYLNNTVGSLAERKLWEQHCRVKPPGPATRLDDWPTRHLQKAHKARQEGIRPAPAFKHMANNIRN